MHYNQEREAEIEKDKEKEQTSTEPEALNINCPGCNTPLNENNLGGYQCYCETCANLIPEIPKIDIIGGWVLVGNYPIFTWAVSSIFEKGRENYFASYDITQNPYKNNSLSFISWAAGFENAKASSEETTTK